MFSFDILPFPDTTYHPTGQEDNMNQLENQQYLPLVAKK